MKAMIECHFCYAKYSFKSNDLNDARVRSQRTLNGVMISRFRPKGRPLELVTYYICCKECDGLILTTNNNNHPLVALRFKGKR